MPPYRVDQQVETAYHQQQRPKQYYPLDYPRSYSAPKSAGYPAPPYYSREPPKNEDSCRVFSKYAIFAFNILFLLVGTATLALGTWLRTDSRFREFLSERYKQVVNEAFWEAPTLFTFSYLLIVLGATMIAVSMIGCCGVAQGSRVFLGFYAAAMFMLLIFTVSCGIYILFRQNGIDVELSDALNYMVEHYYQGASIVQEALDRLQQAFRCCGNAGCSDFRVFRQDPPRTCDLRCDGCHFRITLALKIGFSVAVVVYGICMIAEVIAIGVALVLVFRGTPKPFWHPVYLYPNRDDYERQKIALSRQSPRGTLPRSKSQGWDRTRQYSGPQRQQRY